MSSLYELHEACKKGNIQTVRKYISDKKFDDLNKKNNCGETSFMFACWHNRKEIVELLLKCRDIIVPDIIKTDNEEIKKLIEKYKKDPETVLHINRFVVFNNRAPKY